MKHRITYLDCLRCIAILFCHRPARHVPHPLQPGLLRHLVLVSVSPAKPAEPDWSPPLLHDQRISDPPLPGYPHPVHVLSETPSAAGAPLCAWNLIYLLADALRTGVPVSLDAFFLLPAEPRPKLPHVVRLYDDGDLSGGSLSEADHRRLHGQTAVPASPPHYLPHLYPPPSQHSTAGLHLSVRPHPGGIPGLLPDGGICWAITALADA